MNLKDATVQGVLDGGGVVWWDMDQGVGGSPTAAKPGKVLAGYLLREGEDFVKTRLGDLYYCRDPY